MLEMIEVKQVKTEEVTVSELLNEVGSLSATVSTLQGACGDLTTTNSQLLCNLNLQKDLMDGVCSERDAVLLLQKVA